MVNFRSSKGIGWGSRGAKTQTEKMVIITEPITSLSKHIIQFFANGCRLVDQVFDPTMAEGLFFLAKT